MLGFTSTASRLRQRFARHRFFRAVLVTKHALFFCPHQAAWSPQATRGSELTLPRFCIPRG